ncbi:hypothetical protein IQ17_03242 [Bradyrhizobium daqingense]|uniref:Uncharacterized protein n=1 Tax=Bradyrhizobium daqingense TaxID=993502 RepID=A0A562LBL6_9BRAD|nr:hypothetical protein IQ17_03242 [Bradyrhizobium daqingense]
MASQAGTASLIDTSSAIQPNQNTELLMISGPIVSGSNLMPIAPSALSMRGPSAKKTNAPT